MHMISGWPGSVVIQVSLAGLCMTVLCPPSLLQSGVAGVREKVTRLLDPVLESIGSGGLKGHEALYRELQKT